MPIKGGKIPGTMIVSQDLVMTIMDEPAQLVLPEGGTDANTEELSAATA